MPFRGSLKPYASRAGFPAFMSLIFFRRDRVQTTYSHIDDHFVPLDKLRFPLSLDVDVGVRNPGLGEIEVFLDTVPFRRVESAARQ